MMNEIAGYKIKLPTFEGPFDLLFHLIKKAEVDIWSISIAEITEQYLAYLLSMKELNLEIASEFLVMAATLLRLKSKLLLPRPKRDEDQEEEELFEINTAEELFQRLHEYRIFKAASRYLGEREEEQQKIYLRSTAGQKVIVFTRQESVYTIWEGANHLSDIMHRFARFTLAAAQTPAFSVVEDFIVAEKTANILQRLQEQKKPLPMKDFVEDNSIWEMIITFVALLEMTRQGKVRLLQEKIFGPIIVMLLEDAIREENKGGESRAEKSD